MQLSPRLTTAPQRSACLSKREWPWHAPAPVTHFHAMGASKSPGHAPLSHSSKCKGKTSQQRHLPQQVPLHSLQQVSLQCCRAASTCCPPVIWPDRPSPANGTGRNPGRPA
eukprot:4659988-Pyramimonas_sp.AAC.1